MQLNQMYGNLLFSDPANYIGISIVIMKMTCMVIVYCIMYLSIIEVISEAYHS